MTRQRAARRRRYSAAEEPRLVTASCSICKEPIEVEQDALDRMARWAKLKKMPKRELWEAHCAAEHNHIYLRAVGP